jgi:hypothetical protein
MLMVKDTLCESIERAKKLGNQNVQVEALQQQQQQQQQQHSQYAVEGGGTTTSELIDPHTFFTPTHPLNQADIHDVHLINEARIIHQYRHSYDAKSATVDRSILPPNSSNFIFDENFVIPAINSISAHNMLWAKDKKAEIEFIASKFSQKEYTELEMGLITMLADFDKAHKPPPNLVCCCFCGYIGGRRTKRQTMYENRFHAVADYLEGVNSQNKFIERGIEVRYVSIGGLEGLMVDVSPWKASGGNNMYWDGERPSCFVTPVSETTGGVLHGVLAEAEL